MWPLLVLSFFAMALIIDKAIRLVFFHYDTSKLILCLKRDEVVSIKGFDSKLFTSGTKTKGNLDEEQVQLLFDRQYKSINLIASIGGSAPLLGFIGTVYGMILSFDSISDADRVSVRLVAGGISQALITTGFGLSIAVVCLLAENLFTYYLISRAQRVEEEVNLYIKNHDDSQLTTPE